MKNPLTDPAVGRLALFAGGVLLVLAMAAGFVVKETEAVVVLRFGKPVAVHTAPGWHGKFPWPIDRLSRLDRRLKHGHVRLSETLTRDKRNVIAPMFFAWRIADPARFLASVGSEEKAAEKLDAIVTSARNASLGRHTFDQLVSLDADRAILAKIESEVTQAARQDAATHLGIELVTAGILQLNLPQANTESVFRRMRAERAREATQYRAEGRSKADSIKAEADKEMAIILAEAKRFAEETRGRAEAEAARIYAKAHGEDVEFYTFLRQLQSLRSVIDRNTTLVLGTDIPPFMLLKSGPEGAKGAPLPSSPSPLLPAPEKHDTTATPPPPERNPVASTPLALDGYDNGSSTP